MTSHNLIGRCPRENLQVLSSDDLMCPLHRKSSVVLNTGQTRIGLLLPLSVKRGLFKIGVVISSTEVAGEVVFVVSIPRTAGLTVTVGVTGGPCPITRTIFFSRLDNGSFFLDLILAYISWLNLVIIPKKKKKKKENIVKKKKKEKRERGEMTN